MWILFSLGVGFVAIVIVAVLVTRERQTAPSTSEVSGDDLFALGVIFAGAGVAMAVTLGPFMIWMVALGVIYMAMGTQKKRHQ